MTGAGIFAWTGAALFAASLAYFLFSYAITFGEITIGTVTPRAVAIDIALFSAFALHHSVFARERVRAWVARTCAPRLERSVYVWVASVVFILVCMLWRPVPGVAWELRGPAAWPLPLLQLVGVWLTLRSATIIDVWELAGVRMRKPEGLRPPESGVAAPGVPRPDVVAGGPPPSDAVAGGPAQSGTVAGGPAQSVTGGRRHAGVVAGGLQASGEFRTDGPYGLVRHPIYLGWLLVVFPMATMTMTQLVFAATSSVYILIGMAFEERSLRSASGGAYDAYRQQVRWRLLPGLY